MDFSVKLPPAEPRACAYSTPDMWHCGKRFFNKPKGAARLTRGEEGKVN